MAIRKIDKQVLIFAAALAVLCILLVGAFAYFAYKENNDLIPLGIVAFFAVFGVVVLRRPVQNLINILERENKP